MRHLKDLGVDTSKAYWSRVVRLKEDSDSKSLPISSNGNGLCLITENVEKIPIFTLQDILDLLPNNIKDQDGCENDLTIHRIYNNWLISYSPSDEFEPLKHFETKEIIDAVYEMLCWCIENGYVETNKNK